MLPIFRVIFAAIILAVFANSSAKAEYTDTNLAVAADIYKNSLLRKHGGKANPQQASLNWAAARQMFNRRNWRGALPLYEKAAGLGAKDHRFWIQFSYSLGAVRPARYGQALQTAWLAFRTARTTKQKAQALYYVGFWQEQQGKHDPAIKAYEESVRLVRSSRVRRQLARLIQRYRQQVMSTSAIFDTSTPQICLTFSRALSDQNLATYRQFITLKPTVKAAFNVQSKKLCIEGVAHGVNYTVTVRQGLPDSEGKLKTTKTQNFAVAVPDRTPTVGFRGKSYILPKSGRQGIPIEAVNVSRARLRLLRINDRNLVNEINNNRIRELFSKYDTRDILRYRGELVWTGVIDVARKRNTQVTTAIPFSKIVKNPKPGIYILMASDASKKAGRWETWATQWIVVSDLAVSTYSGRGGLTVFVRSFRTAKPKAGVNLRLIARNNTVLGKAVSDAKGRVTFAPGLLRGTAGNQAAVVMAAGGGDFTFLDIVRPAFDLTDRGVGGRTAPGPVDAYLYTERGVYRPGETVHLTAMLRDARAIAVGKMPLILKLFRPDGVQARKFVLKADASKGGAFRLSLPTSKSFRTGSWTLRAYIDPKAKSVGHVRFQVEDFVPERLEMKLKSTVAALKPGKAGAISVDGRFLYGAPAAKLRVEGDMILKQDMRPYPGYKGYIFGLVQESWSPKRTSLAPAKTDDKGIASLRIALDGAPETSRPLKAEVRVSLLEQGGRAVERVISVPVRWAPLTLGIRLNADGGQVPDGQAAAFSLVALDLDGKPREAKALSYTLYRETFRYYWFYSKNRWNYKRIQNDRVVTRGKLDIASAKPAALSLKSASGRYRLEVRDAKTGAASSYRYYVGWYSAPSSDETPDKLRVQLDKKEYKTGDTAKVFLRGPFAGVVHLIVASDRILESRTVTIPKKGTTIDVAVKQTWGPGVYVLATAYRPIDSVSKAGPARAIGVAYLKRDLKTRTLSVEVEAAKIARPRQPSVVTVKINGLKLGGSAYVTLAAVDEGILSLTGYKSPSPTAYYYGKRKLALEVRDDYGRLIDGFSGQFGRIRSGGDAAGRHLGGLDASSIKTVSLYSGIVKIDFTGRAKIRLDIPDFNGRLRLMAVAWTANAVGAAESKLIVRDPVVSLVTLPRFLAPGDKGQISVSLHNVDGEAGEYKLSFTSAGGAAGFGDNGESEIKLDKDGRHNASLSLNGKTAGVSKLTMKLSGPGGFTITRNWDIAVRPAQARTTRQLVKQLAPNGSVSYSSKTLKGFLPGTARLLISVSNSPDLGVASLISSLSRYPYGCAEQTTSKAMPLLYLSSLASSIGLAADEAKIKGRVQAAIYRVLSMQTSDGSFGLWSSRDSREGWLTAYIMDFLTKARQRGYSVPDYAFEKGLERMGAVVRNLSYEAWNLPVHAYALFVLAANKRTDVATLRYFNETHGKSIPTALGKAQIAAALGLFGDAAQSAKAFSAAWSHKARPTIKGKYWRPFVRDYGSDLRDRTGVLYFTALANPQSKSIPKMVRDLSRISTGKRHLSTQEKAWLLLSANALSGKAPFSVALNEEVVKKRTKPLYRRVPEGVLNAGLTIRNTGKDKVWQSVTVSGIPVKDLPAESKGFVITRAYYTLDGKRVKLNKVKQSDVLVALIQVRATTPRLHQALIVDLLPSGFEIENPRLKGRSVKQMKWLPKLLTPRHIEPRDDRYVAAVDMNGKNRDFYLAYIVRAVTPGTFRLPAPHVEDMYRPSFFGRASMGTVRISPRS